MKKVVSLRELKEYCGASKSHSVLFYTENQDWYSAADSCKLQLSFPVMLISENPALICLKSGVNTLTLDCVQSVEIDTDSTVLGTILRVHCGNYGSMERGITYTLIMT